MTVSEFLQLNESSIGSSGAKWDSCEAINQLNKARSALYGLHNWHGLIQTVCISASREICVPWFADSIKNAYECNSTIPIASGEYFTITGMSCCGGLLHVVDTGEYSPVPCGNSFCTRIGISSTDTEDDGKKVRITYQSQAGSIVTEEFTLSFTGFSVTESRVAKILSVRKDTTFGIVYFHSVNKDETLACKLFCAHPLETHLKYRKYLMNSECPCKQIVIAVKKKYLPFTNAHYNHEIDFIEHGLALTMEAVAEKSKRTPEGLKMYMQLLKASLDYFKINTIKETQSFSDITISMDYPTIEDECGCY